MRRPIGTAVLCHSAPSAHKSRRPAGLRAKTSLLDHTPGFGNVLIFCNFSFLPKLSSA